MKTMYNFLLVALALGLFIFVDLANIDRFLYKVLCVIVDNYFEANCTDFYDIPIWITLSSFGTLVALYAAWSALDQSNKQLKIEQTPYVVLDHIRKVDSKRFGFAIKNVGNGPAFNITFSLSNLAHHRNDAFFSNDQPHSVNLRSGEESHYWKVDSDRFNKLHFTDNFSFVYCYFENQSGDSFRTQIKFKKIIKDDKSVRYIVMSNKISRKKGICV